MSQDNFKTTLLSSFVWKMLERISVFGTSFIIGIILARLLLPEDYGVIALIMVFITLGNWLTQSGLGTALIQKKEVSNLDYSSVFFLTLCIAIVLYAIIFLLSPIVADYYNQPLITPILRVYGLTLFFGAINSIQNAVIARNFQFRKLFICTILSTIISGTIGIAMAFNGFGAWALVGSSLSNTISLCGIMWLTVKWRPKLAFSACCAKNLLSFGWKLMAEGVINIFYQNISTLVIGKLFSISTVGYYTKGVEYTTPVIVAIDNTLQAVMLPAYSKNQDDKKSIKIMMRRIVSLSSFIVCPAMIGLAVVAEPLVTVLLTDKWLMAVPFIQIFAVAYMFIPVQSSTIQAVNAIGRSDIFLIVRIIKVCIGISALLIAIQFGIYAIALSVLITEIAATFVFAYPNRKYFKYTYFELAKDYLPSLFLSVFMGLAVYAVSFAGLNFYLTLILQIVLGIVIYVVMATLFRIEMWIFLKKTVNELFRR